jgi:diguanylate cyclase (GGDEF)-like protein
MVDTIKGKLSRLSPKLKDKVNKIIEDLVDLTYVLYSKSIIDPKTQLYNSRFLEEMLFIEIENSKRYDLKLSLIILDIDFFKKVNDNYGHLAGDRILKSLAKILQKHVRKNDIVARFGGEEFFIMLPNAGLKKAKDIAERLRRGVERGNLKPKITISVGVSEYKKGNNLSDMTKMADRALYKAKEKGRNRVEWG